MVWPLISGYAYRSPICRQMISQACQSVARYRAGSTAHAAHRSAVAFRHNPQLHNGIVIWASRSQEPVTIRHNPAHGFPGSTIGNSDKLSLWAPISWPNASAQPMRAYKRGLLISQADAACGNHQGALYDQAC
jgi:hypothetical protein